LFDVSIRVVERPSQEEKKLLEGFLERFGLAFEGCPDVQAEDETSRE